MLAWLAIIVKSPLVILFRINWISCSNVLVIRAIFIHSNCIKCCISALKCHPGPFPSYFGYSTSKATPTIPQCVFKKKSFSSDRAADVWLVIARSTQVHSYLPHSTGRRCSHCASLFTLTRWSRAISTAITSTCCDKSKRGVYTTEAADWVWLSYRVTGNYNR